MAKVFLFVAREEMVYQAHAILQEYQYPIDEIERINTSDSEIKVRLAEAAGASLIIARGLQAERMKKVTNLPVIEITLTSQEVALLISRAKQILKKETPRIAIVGFKNMFCNMDFFEELYNIELITSLVDRREDLENGFSEVMSRQPDLVIGGDSVVDLANAAGVRSLYLSSTEESLRNAFIMAEKMVYAMEVDRKTAIQLETMLDLSFNAALRADERGKITMVNTMMEDLLGKGELDLKGRKLSQIIPELSEEVIQKVLKDGREHSLFAQIRNYNVYTSIAPILVEGQADGLLINCHKVKRMEATGRRVKSRNQKAQSYFALSRFADLYQESESMKECIRRAKSFVSSDCPIMIQGEAGTERRMMAQSIHNDSPRGGNPFIDVTCAGMDDEVQREFLFGPKGAVVLANGGTLFLRNVEKLTLANQYRLYQLIRFKICSVSDLVSGERIDVRIMYTTKAGLEPILKDVSFRDDLYYALSGLSVKIPPLRERPEDLKKELEDSFRESCEKNSRFHVLTQGAWKALLEYPWHGNHLQITNFCENLVLTSVRRSIDENDVTELLLDAYPDVPLKETCSTEPARWDDEAALIRGTLERNLGNREKTARELGMSKSTLWRKMKKHGVK